MPRKTPRSPRPLTVATLLAKVRNLIKHVRHSDMSPEDMTWAMDQLAEDWGALYDEAYEELQLKRAMAREARKSQRVQH